MLENIITVEYVLDLKAKLKKINDMKLDDIVWVKNGKQLKIDQEIKDDFKFTGLNNVDFITSEFYKSGWTEFNPSNN